MGRMVGNGACYAMGARSIDLTGKRFGRLIVLQKSATLLYGKQVAWNCSCDCGNEKIAITSSLKSGGTKSCGCLGRETKPPIRIKHGMSGYSGIKTWEGMMRRCFNPKDKDYCYYGGRGITVCDRWRDVRNFAADMGEKPSGCSLDRIDYNKDYCPENCRWATAFQQAANKRSNLLIEHEGRVLHLTEWCRRLNMKVSTVKNRLNAGMDPSLALTMPSRRQSKSG